jgi:activator of HSP90 ATPase
MKTKSIKQTLTFNASPAQIYNLIMDEKKHAAFTGSKATIDSKPNGKFSVFDGYCQGYNIELVKDKKIVQAWHFAEDGWPDDHFSICSFELEKEGARTKLRFLQTNVPEHKVETLKDGWKEFYWDAIKLYLKSN